MAKTTTIISNAEVNLLLGQRFGEGKRAQVATMILRSVLKYADAKGRRIDSVCREFDDLAFAAVIARGVCREEAATPKMWLSTDPPPPRRKRLAEIMAEGALIDEERETFCARCDGWLSDVGLSQEALADLVGEPAQDVIGALLHPNWHIYRSTVKRIREVVEAFWAFEEEHGTLPFSAWPSTPLAPGGVTPP